MIKINKKGFTLIELMVVITIIAILAVVGFSIYSGVSSRARDSNRQTEVGEIASALEQHYVATSAGACTVDSGSAPSVTTSTYCPLQPSWFQKGVIPTDPNGTVYCIYTDSDTGSGGQINTLPTYASWAANAVACPAGAKDVAGTNATAVATAATDGSNNMPAVTAKNFAVCTRLENGNQIYCVKNQQQ